MCQAHPRGRAPHAREIVEGKGIAAGTPTHPEPVYGLDAWGPAEIRGSNMTHRALRQQARARMKRTGEKYTDALRALAVIQSTPAPEHYSPRWGEPYYSLESYDHEPYGPSGDFVAYTDETDETSETVVPATDGGLDWTTIEAKTRIARAILEHRLGRPADNDLIDQFLIEIASGWEDGVPWTVFSGDLADRLGV